MNLLCAVLVACQLAAAAAAPVRVGGAALLREKLGVLEELNASGAITDAELTDARAEALRAFASGAPADPRSSPPAKPSAPGAGPFNTLVFSDEFDTFNLTTWQHEITAGGGGNWEFEYYANNRSTSFVRDGKLFLKPRLTSETMGAALLVNGGTLDLWGGAPANSCTGNAFYGCQRASNGQNILNPIKSARLRTVNSFSFKYGRVEVSAKLPRGDWIWPAIWMLPAQEQYGIWPASGEIDIMESRGNAASYAPGGVNKIGSTLHWGPYYGADQWPSTHEELTAPKGTDWADGFHTYGMEWTEDYLITYVDDRSNTVLNVTFPKSGYWVEGNWSKITPPLVNPWAASSNHAAPFDQDFYLVFNVAVGGTNPYFPDGVGGKCWKSTSQTAALDFWNCRDEWLKTWSGDDVAMQIESVKVWQQ